MAGGAPVPGRGSRAGLGGIGLAAGRGRVDIESIWTCVRTGSRLGTAAKEEVGNYSTAAVIPSLRRSIKGWFRDRLKCFFEHFHLWMINHVKPWFSLLFESLRQDS